MAIELYKTIAVETTEDQKESIATGNQMDDQNRRILLTS